MEEIRGVLKAILEDELADFDPEDFRRMERLGREEIALNDLHTYLQLQCSLQLCICKIYEDGQKRKTSSICMAGSQFCRST